MEKITSMFDFYQKVKKDKRYEKLAAYSYKEAGNYGETSYEEAKKWMDNWIDNNKHCCTCSEMVEYLNNNIPNITYKFPASIPPEPIEVDLF